MDSHPPFYDKEPYGIYEKIIKHDIQFPKNIQGSAKDLIRKLLEKDPEQRLGAKDVKKYKIFL